MPWYLRTVGQGGEAVEYATPEQALGHVKALIAHQHALGHQVVKEDGRISIYDGHQLVDTVWVEDEDGKKLPLS